MAVKSEKMPAPVGVLSRYLAMGHWKSKFFKKKGKASRTSSSIARPYIAHPPEGGWIGGTPGPATGLRARGK